MKLVVVASILTLLTQYAIGAPGRSFKYLGTKLKTYESSDVQIHGTYSAHLFFSLNEGHSRVTLSETGKASWDFDRPLSIIYSDGSDDGEQFKFEGRFEREVGSAFVMKVTEETTRKYVIFYGWTVVGFNDSLGIIFSESQSPPWKKSKNDYYLMFKQGKQE